MRISSVGVERVHELEQLWKALQEHHARVMPSAGGLVPRDLQESWEMRRRKYLALLDESDAFLLIAEDDDQLLGYAMVRVSDGSIGYVTGPRVGDVETLSVIPAARGRGVGSALMAAVESRLSAIGVEEVRLAVVSGNDDAIRFYERRGLARFAITLIGRLPSA